DLGFVDVVPVDVRLISLGVDVEAGAHWRILLRFLIPTAGSTLLSCCSGTPNGRVQRPAPRRDPCAFFARDVTREWDRCNALLGPGPPVAVTCSSLTPWPDRKFARAASTRCKKRGSFSRRKSNQSSSDSNPIRTPAAFPCRVITTSSFSASRRNRER